MRDPKRRAKEQNRERSGEVMRWMGKHRLAAVGLEGAVNAHRLVPGRPDIEAAEAEGSIHC